MSQYAVPTRRAESGSRGQTRLGRPLHPQALPRALRGGLRPASTRPLGRLLIPRGALGAVKPVRALRRSRRAATRRRNVLSVLFGALMVAIALGLATGAAGAWWAVVAVLPLACGYVALVARARRVAAEREFRMAFLPAKVSAVGLDDLFSRPDDEPSQVMRHIRARARASG